MSRAKEQLMYQGFCPPGFNENNRGRYPRTIDCNDDSLCHSGDESSENLSSREPSAAPSELNQQKLPPFVKTVVLDSDSVDCRGWGEICEHIRTQNPTIRWESLGGQATLDWETAKKFVRAVHIISPEQMQHAYNCKKEGIVYQAANSKKNACIYARRILLVESDFLLVNSELLVESDFPQPTEKKVPFCHHNTRNNFDTTLSLNIEKMVGHILLPYMIKALVLLFPTIQYITMPPSNKQTITQVHINFATPEDKQLAKHFITYYTQVSLDLMATCEDGSAIEDVPKLRDLIGHKDDGKHNLIGIWTRDKFVPKDTFELENGCIVRHVYDGEETRVEVPVSEIKRWMVRELENGNAHYITRRKQNGKKGGKNEPEGAKQIGDYCVIEFDHEFNLNYDGKNKDVTYDIKIKVVHHNPSSGAVAVEMSQDKHIISLGTERTLEIQIPHVGSHSSEIAYRTGPASVESESSTDTGYVSRDIFRAYPNTPSSCDSSGVTSICQTELNLSATPKQPFKYPHTIPTATPESRPPPSPSPFDALPQPSYPTVLTLGPQLLYSAAQTLYYPYSPPVHQPFYHSLAVSPVLTPTFQGFTASPHNVVFYR